MAGKAGDTANASGEEEGWEPESDMRIRMTVERWSGRSQRGNVGLDSDEGGSGWGCDQAPSEGKSDTGKQDIGSSNGLGGGKNDKPGGNKDEWKGEGPAHFLWSTKTRPVEERVPHQTQEGGTRPRCSRKTWYGWRGR